jgi:hypothetical protein
LTQEWLDAKDEDARKKIAAASRWLGDQRMRRIAPVTSAVAAGAACASTATHAAPERRRGERLIE